jgi:Metallo-peptidase family M12B Reprolysin-like
MRIAFAVAVIILTSGGCVGGDDAAPPALADPCSAILLQPATGATAAELAAIVDAAGMWGAVAGTNMSVTGDGLGGAATAIPIRFASAPLAFLGAYEVKEGDLVINADIADEATRAIIVAHELGHAFGLSHVAGRASVMNAGNATVPPNALDAADLVARWGACQR